MSDEPITLGEIHRLLLEVRADVKLQNGTVNRHETRIALLESRSDALETSDRDARSMGGRWGVVGGGLIAGLIYGLQQLFGGGK